MASSAASTPAMRVEHGHHTSEVAASLVQEGGHHAPSHEQHTASAAPATTASDVELTSHHGNEQASSSKSAKAPSSNEEGSLRKKQSRRNANPWLALPLFIAGLGVLWLARRTRNKKQSTGATRARSATAARSPAKSKAGAGSPASKRKGSSRAAATSKDAAAASVVAGAEDQGAPQAEEEVVEPALPDSFTIRASDAAIAPAPPPPAPLAPPPLNGLSFVVSEDIELETTPTTYGSVTAWAPYVSNTPAAGSAPLVKRALAAGAACTGKGAVQPALQDSAGADYGNPHNKARMSGGPHTGSAALVAEGGASFALATDVLGEARLPASCCSLYAYRPTPGQLGGPSAGSPAPALSSAGGPVGAGSGPGSKVADNHGSLCVLTRDAGTLVKVSQALGAPGSGNIRGEVIKFVVAQDLFDMCAPEFQPAILALKKAILKWAGSDQAGAVQLVRFLSSNVHGWQTLCPPPDTSDPDNVRINDFLEACLAAGQALQAQDAHERMGALEEAYIKAASSAAEAPQGPAASTSEQGAADASAEVTASVSQKSETAGAGAPPQEGGEEEDTGKDVVKSGQHEDQSAVEVARPPAASEEQQQQESEQATSQAEPPRVLPPPPSPNQLAAARDLSRRVLEVLRDTVKPDTIMVLPALPFPPPKRGAAQVEMSVFVKLTRAFNVLATLGSCPTVTVPVGQLRDGSPVAISLLAVHKFDARLLAVAQKLCPMIEESFEAVKQEITQMAAKQAQEEAEAAARAAAQAAESAAGGSQGSSRPSANGNHAGHSKAAPGPDPSAVDPRKAEKAEKAKAKGNELFLAGKYAEAVNEYTRAISLNPSTHVYYSNRAMACIKMFRFEQAEDDCNKALKFQLSDKDKVKALLRRATARDALQKYEAAEEDLRAVLKIEPMNKQAREDLQGLKRHRAEMAAAQASMVAQLRAQAAAAAANGGAGAAGANGGGTPVDPAAAAAGAFLPPGMQLPPGLDPAQLKMLADGWA